MRIKFRAWHKAEKKMYQVCGMDYVINLDADCVEIDSVQCANYENGRWSNGGAYSIEDVVLMQYTGLKDKNGAEIYEGDIVLHSTAYKNTYKVGFQRGEFTANSTKKGDNDVICPLMFDRVEVIGNIYENQKLLEK